MIFAQLPVVSPEQLGIWLACLAGVVLLADRIKGLVVRKPPIEAEFVSKADCTQTRVEIVKRVDRLECEVGAIRAEMKADRKEILDAGERRAVEIHNHISRDIKGVHDRVDVVLKAVSRVEGRTEKE